jgi:glycosyltransferase involved in cell wall biosynthesis
MAVASRISVVLCTCNGQAYLAEQLSTLLTQSRLPDEVVIGDDDSTDGTWAIVQDFAALARTRGVAVQAVRRTRRLGYVANFSAALALSSGDLVFLCDQDDAWHPDKIATMASRFLADATLTFLHSDARLVTADGADMGCGLFEALELSSTERGLIAGGEALRVYLRRNIATGATAVFRRELLDRALPVPSAWVHDAWLATLAAATGKVDFIDDPLIDYRQHDDNQIGMRPRTWQTRLVEFRMPRGDELRAAMARVDALDERLDAEGADDDARREIDATRQHLARRLRIGSRAPVFRLPSVAWEWLTGSYARFATGTRTALRDLMRKG